MGGRRQSLPIIYVVTIYRSKCEQVRDSVPLVAPTIHVLMRVLQMPLRFHSLHVSLMINGYNLKVIWMELSYFSQFCDITTLKINYLFALISFLMKQLIDLFSAFRYNNWCTAVALLCYTDFYVYHHFHIPKQSFIMRRCPLYNHWRPS